MLGRRVLTCLLFLLILLNASLANACLWDRDTLAQESDGMPGMVDILVGRFERQPPRYYSMRLERVTQELQADSARLDFYDDAAVACDKLGRQDEAIAWMAKKKTELDKNDTTQGDAKEHLYRYYANLGTFYAHRWLKNGAVREDLSDMETGRDLIAKAIEINPDAHFGREKWQLRTMEWIIELPVDRVPSWPVADGKFAAITDHGSDTPTMMGGAEGLSGMIVMGGAWESVDIFFALTTCFGQTRDASLALLTLNRCVELLQENKRSLHPHGPELKHFLAEDGSVEPLSVTSITNDKSVNAFFPKAREAANAWHAHRIAYMNAQFDKDMHPDTHADFWADYEALDNAPTMPGDSLFERASSLFGNDPVGLVLGISLISIVTLLVVKFVIRWILTSRRRRIA